MLTVREGHVGVYYRGGALMGSVSDPGFHTQVGTFALQIRRVTVF